MKFLCSRHSSIELKDGINCCTGAASVLPVCNIKTVLAALNIRKYKLTKTG